MRRIALRAVAVALVGGGCQSIQTPWAAPRSRAPVESVEGAERPARAGVPDSVMLRDQARGGFGETPVAP